MKEREYHGWQLGLLLTLLLALPIISTDIYLPSLHEIAGFFNAGPEDVQLTLTLYFFTFGLVQLIYGSLSAIPAGASSSGVLSASRPLIGESNVKGEGISNDLGAEFTGNFTSVFVSTNSDLAGCNPAGIAGSLSDSFGRRPVLLASLFIYILATMLCICSSSIQMLVLGRCLQALGTGSAILTFAIVRDLYEGRHVAKMIAYMSAVVALSPIIAPIIGGYIQSSLSWRWNFIVLIFAGSALLVTSYYMLPETNRYKGAQKYSLKKLFMDYRILLMNKNYICNALSAAFAFGALFTYISASHYIFLDLMGYSPQLFGWTFAVAAIGYVLGAFTGGRLTRISH